MGVNSEYQPDRYYEPFGPFIPKNFVSEHIKNRTVIIGATIFAVSTVFTLTAAYISFIQTRRIRKPWRSAYVWMIWMENVASTTISVVCLLHIIKIIRPSFYFYFFLLFLWAIQVQLLLQIIINRIRVILPDRRKGKIIMISVAVLVMLIVTSVYCIWLPARLQISERYININNIWDRIEKVIYLIIDAALNWYFIHVVRANLVHNGLQKYNKLVRMNQKLIVISLLMDVMIIAAMSIPNGLLYASFHPLAYLVKLNIEMIMANLIRKIALESSHDEDFHYEFGTSSNSSARGENPDSLPVPTRHRSMLRPWSWLEPSGNEIRKTREYIVQSASRSAVELRGGIGPNGQKFGNVSSANSTRAVKDTDARSWVEGDDVRNEFMGVTRISGGSGPSEETGSSGSTDEEAGLVAPEAAHLKW